MEREMFVLSIGMNVVVCPLVLAAPRFAGLERAQATPLAGGAFLLPEGAGG